MDVLIQLLPLALLLAGAVGVGVAVRRISLSPHPVFQNWSRRPWLHFFLAQLLGVPFLLLPLVARSAAIPLSFVAFASATQGLRMARAQSRLHYWGVLATGLALVYLNRAIVEAATGQQVRTLTTTPFVLLPLALAAHVASSRAPKSQGPPSNHSPGLDSNIGA